MSGRKRGHGCMTIFIVVFILLIAASLVLTNKDRIINHFFPLDNREEIEIIAAEYAVDPWLIMAVIREESGYDENAKSSVGACGLMQLMPDTASWINQKAGFAYDIETDIWDPLANIRMGTWYISWLMCRYNGNTAAAVAAYNGGITNVDSWLEQGDWDGDIDDVSGIPFAETRKFVQYVFESYDMYVFLYQTDK